MCYDQKPDLDARTAIDILTGTVAQLVAIVDTLSKQVMEIDSRLERLEVIQGERTYQEMRDISREG